MAKRLFTVGHRLIALENRRVDAEGPDVDRAWIARTYSAIRNEVYAFIKVLGVNGSSAPAAWRSHVCFGHIHVRARTKQDTQSDNDEMFHNVMPTADRLLIEAKGQSLRCLMQLSCRPEEKNTRPDR